MPSVLFEALVILLLIILNGVFAMSEIAVVSARKTRLEQWANEGDGKARAALELANAPNQFLATIQIGITLIGILAGAFGGATIARAIAVGLDEIPIVAPYSRPVSLAIVVLIITFLSLIVGELVPKRLALNSPERIASTMATPMRALARLASPVVYVLDLSTDAILRVLGMRPVVEPPVTEEEIRALIAQGTQAGMFEEAEQEMVERVFRLGDRRVSAVMTPRTEIVWVDSEAPLEEIQQTIAQSTHSRILVAQGSLDDVLGVVHAKELLLPLLRGEPLDLTAVLRQPLYVPESMRALEVLELFKQSATHIALVIDEYGGVQGLVTPSDILEAIVGDLPEPGEQVDPLAVQREDGSWLLDGMLSIDDFKELFHLGRLPDEDQGVYQTLAGFVIMQLGRIPAVSDHFEWGGLRIEVVDMDGNRVDKVLAHPRRDTTSAAEVQV
ncbi:MAG TPA: hemolysin family protein [Candidatus Tectomicrobia bacterium]|jgi:putative hemolysin|nr:hemolysin family protein [Candidatus Tectomicrobia bacterium]